MGAAVLAGGVQAIFLLMPEPQSAGATEPGAPEAIAAFDSTAFTLEEDSSVLPGPERRGQADSLRRWPRPDSVTLVAPAVPEPAVDQHRHALDSAAAVLLVPRVSPVPAPTSIPDSTTAPTH